MKKILLLITTVFLLTFGIDDSIKTVEAKEIVLSSRGNMIYQESDRQAAIYIEDLLLLRDKLSGIPEENFDPIRYTHTHSWEYRDVNKETHTRRCSLCGPAFDLVSRHKAERTESCLISSGTEDCPGKRCTCACGYQWTVEAGHTMTYEAVDETNHRICCILDGTEFCSGFRPIVEEHYAYNRLPCEDGLHHRKVCMDCEYDFGEEVCRFILAAGLEEDDDRDPDLLYCECGNGKKKETDDQEPPAEGAGNPESSGNTADSAEKPEEDAGAEKAPDDDSDSAEKPGTGSDETGKPDESSDADDEPDDFGAGERPGDDSGVEENPGEDSGAEENPGGDAGVEETPKEDTGTDEKPGQDSGSTERSDEESETPQNSEKEPDKQTTPVIQNPGENETGEETIIRYEGKVFA